MILWCILIVLGAAGLGLLSHEDWENDQERKALDADIARYLAENEHARSGWAND